MENKIYGWICPLCHKVFAPHITQCLACNNPKAWNTPTIVGDWEVCGQCGMNAMFCNCTKTKCLLDGIDLDPNSTHTISCPCPKCLPTN